VTPMSAELANKAATIPAGGVVFFQSNVCPAGWSEYVPARGRYVLGVPTGGTLGATYGTPLANLEERNHSHSVSSSATTQMSGSHNHAWSRLFINPAGDRVWTSYNAEGTEVFLINWSNGVGNEGSGYYPLAASPTQTFHTYYSGVHQHDVQVVGSTGEAASYLPYIQLLACRKD
jgi:hypothetical protein